MKPSTPRERYLRKWMERAVIDFKMIEPGDRIVVAVSGGKDSLSLSLLLTPPFVYIAGDAHIEYVHVDGGFPGFDSAPLKQWFDERGKELHVIKRNIFEESFGQKKSPCFLCARKRRRALLETAKELGCAKIAFAHHRDDAVESFLMNISFNREISAMMPSQPLFSGAYHIIRPLYYISASLIRRFAREQEIVSLENACPVEKTNKREFIRKMLETLRAERPKIDENIFAATFRVRGDYIPSPPDGKNPPRLPREV